MKIKDIIDDEKWMKNDILFNFYGCFEWMMECGIYNFVEIKFGCK